MRGDIHSIPPGLRAAELSLLKAARFSWEDVPEQPNEINHLILAAETWPELSTSAPVWKGQWCKCCGQGGVNAFQRSAQPVLPLLCRPVDQKATAASHSTSSAWCECLCVKRWMGLCVCVWDVIQRGCKLTVWDRNYTTFFQKHEPSHITILSLSF